LISHGDLGPALRARLALAGALLLAAALPAVARDVVVTNELSEPIYKLYVWPSDLVPRTYSVLPSPLMPRKQTTIKVEDVYGDCTYTFKADLTAPRGRRQVKLRQYRKPRPRNLYIYNIDLCLKKSPVEFEDAIGTNYGR
jgi:hypothetical protein